MMRKFMIGVVGLSVIFGSLIYFVRSASDYDVKGEIVEVHQLDSSLISVKGQRFSKYPKIHINVTDSTILDKQNNPASISELVIGQRVGVKFEDAAVIALSDPPITRAKEVVILN